MEKAIAEEQQIIDQIRSLNTQEIVRIHDEIYTIGARYGKVLEDVLKHAKSKGEDNPTIEVLSGELEKLNTTLKDFHEMINKMAFNQQMITGLLDELDLQQVSMPMSMKDYKIH